MAEVIDKDEEDNITYQVVDPEADDEDDDNIEPPFVIVVQGSKESGKTTLIKSLV